MARASRFLLGGIMGHPVMHSRSPAIHNGWLDDHGIEGRYVKLAIEPHELRDALRALPRLKFAGVNLTIPHKEAALALLDEVEPAARRIGAVNLVVVRDDGSLFGRNTDAPGYVASVRETVPTWRADAGPIVVLGAGGGARAILVALLAEGARSIRIVNRTDARARDLARELGPAVTAVPWTERATALAGAAMLVNTTSQGMHGQPPLDLALDQLPGDALVSDIVYVPLETPLLAAARARGNPVVDGLGMLLHQAVPTFEALFGARPAVTAAVRARVLSTL